MTHLDEAAPVLPLGRVIADQLELMRSHKISVGECTAMIADVAAGSLRPEGSTGQTAGFDDLPGARAGMDRPSTIDGMTVAVL